MAETPKEIHIVGRGLIEPPGRFDYILEQLGGLLAGHAGVEVKTIELRPNRLDEGLVSIDDFNRFTDEAFLTAGVGTRVWSSLQKAYRQKVIHQQAELASKGMIEPNPLDCPIEFVSDETAGDGNKRAGYLLAETIPPTVAWLQDKFTNGLHPGHRLGASHGHYLAAFYNHTYNPSEPLAFNYHEIDYKPIAIPPTEAFEPDLNSPYLEKLNIDGNTALFVSEAILMIFAANELQLPAARNFKIRSFFKRAIDLKRSREIKWQSLTPAAYQESDVAILDLAGERINNAVWGIKPSAFIDVVHRGLRGEKGLPSLKSGLTGHILTNYINAIHKPGSSE
jgi:hypothetical protein